MKAIHLFIFGDNRGIPTFIGGGPGIPGIRISHGPPAFNQPYPGRGQHQLSFFLPSCRLAVRQHKTYELTE